ncbi:PALB protein [Drechmeria coniospora]|uniref:PALB protein n=1 Tax=Drechmeria coniospora TaxID=98403 RepID=A0A151GBR5_DRECN|nr:PALB protein [Drechmeria coniospora]KYK54547.1 PALB protein [Drechmeria coniospora]
MERRALAAEAKLARSSGHETLSHAIRGAELYMAAAAEASNEIDAARLRRKCRELILFAEKLKAAPSSPQLHILQRASRLHGNDFPPWDGHPSPDEFDLAPGVAPFTDDALFRISPTQAANFSAWTRPAQVFGLVQDRDEARDEECMMQLTGHADFVQDITTDCSVVASLSAAAKVLVGKHAVLSSILYPFNHVKGRPALSASGKYVLRMNFNGCFRRVVVDDRLPASRTDRALFVIDRQNPRLLWPALLEKAEDFNLDETWDRIKAAHERQDVVVTLGTGRISAEEERLMGLIGEHDYAVEELLHTSHDGSRSLLIKNPWCDAPLMTGTRLPGDQGTRGDNTAWMALEDVAQHFESMYLNWNPGLFPHRQDHHFTWQVPPKYLAASLVRNPQFTISSSTGGTIWVLVSRHFVDAELDIARNRGDSMAAVARQLGFMSILVFDNHGKRVQVSDGETYRGPYVDSPQTLARLESSPGKKYTLVVDQHELPLSNYTFTMSLFSHAPLEVMEATEEMQYVEEKLGSWGRRTAGGNSSCPTFCQNPQYKLSISKPGPVSILLCTDDRDLHVHVDLVWAQGRRVTTVRNRDLASSSGEYRRGCAMAEVATLEAGTYTVVCSTFDPGQTAAFSLRVASMHPVNLDSVPVLDSGRLRTPLAPLRFLEGDGAIRMSLEVSWLTRASISVRTVQSAGAEDRDCQGSSPMIRVSVVQGWGPEQTTMAVSGGGRFQEAVVPIRTTEFDLNPDRLGNEALWLVLESVGTNSSAWTIMGDIMSDSPVQISQWERQ